MVVFCQRCDYIRLMLAHANLDKISNHVGVSFCAFIQSEFRFWGNRKKKKSVLSVDREIGSADWIYSWSNVLFGCQLNNRLVKNEQPCFFPLPTLIDSFIEIHQNHIITQSTINRKEVPNFPLNSINTGIIYDKCLSFK